jgi:predicted nuclease of restriction endonuclease-like RecB superfamily
MSLDARALRRDIRPDYFQSYDHRWLSCLIDEFERFQGKPHGDLRERLREPLTVPAPLEKLHLAIGVLERLWRRRIESPIPPRRVREAVCLAAARHSDRKAALASAARALGIERDRVVGAMLADVPNERRMVPPVEPVTVLGVEQLANAALVASLLRRAVTVRVIAEGSLRPLIRQAKWLGLLCHVLSTSAREPSALSISGPYALFRRTTVYGRALASLIGRLGGCDRVLLRAECVFVVDGVEELRTLTIRSGDPILVPPPGRPFDSDVEERFAREFAKLAPEWDVVREPAAIEAGGRLVFPDFMLRHRHDPQRSWLVEIIGFWTAQYLTDKLEGLRAARIDNLIVCIDEDRNCGSEDLPPTARVVSYRKRVDAARVLEVMR